MVKRIRISILVLLLIFGISVSGFAQVPTLAELQRNVDKFSESLAQSLPFNSSLGLNWSDAYIGKLFPSLPPHFGIGGSFGITTMDFPVINNLMENFGYSVPFDLNSMILPAYTAEARIGGLFLPFDLGFKFGYLPQLGIWGTSMEFDYLLVGGDLRYKLVDLKLLKVSAGVGDNYLRGSIAGKVGSIPEITYSSYSITIDNPEVRLKWDSTSIDFKAQVSLHLLIITPYLGLGGSYSWSNAGYSIKASINDSSGNFDNVKEYLKDNGLSGVDISDTGISSIIENSAFSFRAFGGLSLNLALFRIDLTGLYNFRDSNYGASIGFRFQL